MAPPRQESVDPVQAEVSFQTFWGTALEGTRSVFTYCVDDKTEILTSQGWKGHNELTTEDTILSLDPKTDKIVWEPVKKVNRFAWHGNLTRWQNRGIDALTTPAHRWLVQDWRARDARFAEQGPVFKRTRDFTPGRGSDHIITGGGIPSAFADVAKYSDDFVELAAWIVTEGHYRHYKRNESTIVLTQSENANAPYVARIRRLMNAFQAEGASFREWSDRSRPDMIRWFISKDLAWELRRILPDRQMTPEFLCSLTYHQAILFYNTLMDGDGHRHVARGVNHKTEIFAQKDLGRLNGFQMLCAMLGKRTNCREHDYSASSYVTVFKARHLISNTVRSTQERYDGVVWCPSVRTKTWLARRNGITYWTGNTELMTEDSIQEFVNDELIDSRENPIGTIPIVHIANTMVPGSPWGLSDIQDITELNRLYNEVSTLLADIINYYAAPVTVITGAKQNNLERGPKKVWTVPNENAKIQNLATDADIAGVLSFLATVKQGMHEITGVPESALGQAQPVSNTSGVALSIMYQPLMNRFHQKSIQYGTGLKRVNELILRYLALYEPWRFTYDPTVDAPLQPGQFTQLDTRDPSIYETTVEFSPPLPIDHLVALNEIQLMMGLGLESKAGALRRLGEAYPQEKLQELYNELVEDAKQAGALDLLKGQISQLLWELGGVPMPGMEGSQPPPPGGTSGVVSAGGNGVTSAGSPAPPSVMQVDPAKGTEELYNALTTMAMGTKLPQRRAPDSSNPSNPD